MRCTHVCRGGRRKGFYGWRPNDKRNWGGKEERMKEKGKTVFAALGEKEGR